jgi:glycolate oxidase FAD binding subunit
MQTSTLQAALEPLVGDHVYPARESDAVAGVQPQLVVEPGNEEEVAAVLAFANREGLKVLVRGGGTQLNIGKPPTGGDLLLSMRRLNQVIEHAPHDLVASVQAGLPLSALQSTLASAQQWLALDPPLGPEATIGGLISTNASGPRRLRYGGVRDQIIGIRVVLPDGTIAKGGGRVVKNVAGYDLPKLYTGALGTLGVVVAANFRLYPLPSASCTALLTASNMEPLGELVLRVLDSPLVPTVIDMLSPAGQEQTYTLALRFEMGQQAVDDQTTLLIEMAGALKETVRKLQDDDEDRFWSQTQQNMAIPGNGPATAVLKASLLPTDVVPWLHTLQRAADQANLALRWHAHAGHGLIFITLSGDEAAFAPAIETARQAALERQGSLVVQEAPVELLRTLDVWGPVPALDVMRRLKAQFDPNMILNPGRFVGGI